MKHASPTLLLINTQNNKQIFTLNAHSIVGTESSADIQIQNHSKHTDIAKIMIKPDGILIKSLCSDQLVKLNNIPIIEAIAQVNDTISFSEKHTYKFTTSTIEKQNRSILTSKNKSWNDQLKNISSIAMSDFPVLILGPSGVGKEELTKIIHSHSARKAGPLVSVNCSALSDSLIESELFGHKKGSFTGAHESRKGAFEAARGGTLFLDEIGDLPIDLQPKLLRALENSEIRPVGSDQTIKTNVRIIAATHQNLEKKVSKKQFREDLFYRLNILKITPPSLKDRMEDFNDLIMFFCMCYRVNLSVRAIQQLKLHSWPGNIRELKNFVARASALVKNRPVQINDLQNLIDHFIPIEENDPHFSKFDIRKTTAREAEKKLILKSLVLNNGNQRRVSKQLGMPKSTLNDKIKTYDINISEIKLQLGLTS